MTFRRGRKQEFFANELIGKRLKVTSSSSKDLQEVVGKIIDETVNTFVIQTNVERKVIPKSTCMFQIGDYTIAGKELVGRSEDRTKKFLK